MKKLLLATTVFAALSVPAFAETVFGANATAGAPGSAQERIVRDSSDSDSETPVVPVDQTIDYSTTQSIPEQLPLGLQLRNEEILYNRFNR
jgi:hypothetical protein